MLLVEYTRYAQNTTHVCLKKFALSGIAIFAPVTASAKESPCSCILFVVRDESVHKMCTKNRIGYHWVSLISDTYNVLTDVPHG